MLDQHPDRRRSAMSGLIAAFLVIASLYFAREVLVPLALAGLIAFLLAPPATQMERRGVPKTLASLLVAGATFTMVCVLGWFVLGQAYNRRLNSLCTSRTFPKRLRAFIFNPPESSATHS